MPLKITSISSIIDEIEKLSERISVNLNTVSDFDIPFDQERILHQRICGSLSERVETLKKGINDDLVA